MAKNPVLLSLFIREVMFIYWKQFGEKKASLQCPTEGDTAVDIFNYVPPDVKSSRGSPRFSSLMNRTYILSKAWEITANILGSFNRSGLIFIHSPHFQG